MFLTLAEPGQVFRVCKLHSILLYRDLLCPQCKTCSLNICKVNIIKFPRFNVKQANPVHRVFQHRPKSLFAFTQFFLNFLAFGYITYRTEPFLNISIFIKMVLRVKYPTYASSAFNTRCSTSNIFFPMMLFCITLNIDPLSSGYMYLSSQSETGSSYLQEIHDHKVPS